MFECEMFRSDLQYVRKAQQSLVHKGWVCSAKVWKNLRTTLCEGKWKLQKLFLWLKNYIVGLTLTGSFLQNYTVCICYKEQLNRETYCKQMCIVVSTERNNRLQDILLHKFEYPINFPLASRCSSRFPLKRRSVRHMARVRPLKSNHWASQRRWK